MIEKYISMAVSHEGFSLVEVISPCPTYFGRYNKVGSAPAMLNWLKENAVPVERASKLSDEERKETFVTGIFADKKRAILLVALRGDTVSGKKRA